MIASICSEPKILEVFRVVNIFINIIRIVVPILLIFSLMFKFMSVIKTGNDDNLNKVKHSAVYNIVAAVIIFLIPNIVNIIVKMTFSDNDYKNCLTTNYEVIIDAYNNKMESLVSKAEQTINIHDYNVAYSYLNNIKDEYIRNSYEVRLKNVKNQIDEKNKSTYAKIDYSNFKWTLYGANSGPITKYYNDVSTYAIWAPDNIKDLNGESLPLIVWYHGAGEFKEKVNDKKFFENNLIIKIISNWKNSNLEPIPAIVVAPQGVYGWWSGKKINNDTVVGLVKYCIDNYNIDKNKIVFAGHSSGGFGAVEMTWGLKDKISVYKIVTMSSQQESYKWESGGKEFYSKIPIRGYGEIKSQQKLFDWVGQPNNFTYYNGETHSNVPERAFKEDLNNNGISDLIEWLFYNN